MAENIILNKFDPSKTDTVIIHDGKFHADDIMFAALALVSAEKHKRTLNIVRTSIIPDLYDERIVVGDIGGGIYDHHNDGNGKSLGAEKNTPDHLVAACGLLFEDVKDDLFVGETETKAVFSALIDIIEHCDNTSDNNTFSDSIMLLFPTDEVKIDAMAQTAIKYCKEVVQSFVIAHEKEKKGKVWAIPKVFKGVYPGLLTNQESRYTTSTHAIKKNYQYVSFNNTKEITIKSLDTFGLVCSVLTQQKRNYWQNRISNIDAENTAEMDRREREEWPVAVAEMKNRTMVLDNYIPIKGYLIKRNPVLFIITPSSREGWNITAIKTSNGKFRCDTKFLKDQEGCNYIANDGRFLSFDTKEHAIAAAHYAGGVVDKFLKMNGLQAYRSVYGGLEDECSGNVEQDLIAEDIALNIFVKETVKNIKNISPIEFKSLQQAISGNPYLIHCFCSHLNCNLDTIVWEEDLQVISPTGQPTQMKTLLNNGRPWNIGL